MLGLLVALGLGWAHLKRFAVVAGYLIEGLGDCWAAFSPISGASHLLNDSSAAILDVLRERGQASAAEVASVIASDVEQPSAEIEQILAPHWDELLRAGLIRTCPAA